MSHSSGSINSGSCCKNLELSRDKHLGSFTWEVLLIAKGIKDRDSNSSILSEGLTLLAIQPPATWVPKSKRKYHQADFDSLVKEEYTVTNKDYLGIQGWLKITKSINLLVG